jgi:hypothetical protein
LIPLETDLLGYLTASSVAQPHPTDGFTQDKGLPAVQIVLGVVGHRDIRNRKDGERIWKTMVKLFREFMETYKPAPLVVLTSLAEGADQLAALAAIQSGAFVRAPSPFEREFYRQSTSFDTDRGRKLLNKILDHKRVDWFVVPTPPGADPGARTDPVADRFVALGLPEGVYGATMDWVKVAKQDNNQDRAYRDLRHACYVNAGGYLIRRCHALVALWDGVETGRP